MGIMWPQKFEVSEDKVIILTDKYSITPCRPDYILKYPCYSTDRTHGGAAPGSDKQTCQIKEGSCTTSESLHDQLCTAHED
jgi:hypothetical protein